MQNRRNTDLLLDYCAERLDRNAAAELTAHIASCAACAQFVREQDQAWRSLDLFEPAAVSPDFDRRLFDRIAAEESRTEWWRALWPGRRPAAALSFALASLLVLAALLIERPRPSIAPAPAAARVEALDPDRIEKALDDVDMLRELNVAGTPDARSM